MDVLTLALSYELEPMEIVTSKGILELIQSRAIALWGEKTWRAKLAREYVNVVTTNDIDSNATYETRRRQVHKVFETYSCTLETAIALAAAVGCRFQMACTTTEIIDL